MRNRAGERRRLSSAGCPGARAQDLVWTHRIHRARSLDEAGRIAFAPADPGFRYARQVADSWGGWPGAIQGAG